MNRGLTFMLFLTLFLPLFVLGKTRQQVIDDVIVYTTYSWTPKNNNLLDAQSCVVFERNSVKIATMTSGSNNIDDRREKPIGDKCEVSSKNWPFEVCSTCTYIGEAYAYGGWDSVNEFATNISTNWIVGRRGIGNPMVPEPLPSTGKYKGFTGIDCSGLVSRVINLSDHIWTGDLKNKYVIIVSTDKIKKGDLLFMVERNHVVIVSDDKLSGGNVGIIHAGSWKYENSEYSMRVTSERTEYKFENGELYLRYKSATGNEWDEEKRKHIAYSAFPQFEWVGSSMNVVEVMVKSGSAIGASGVSMKVIDEDKNEINISDLNVSTGSLSGTGYYAYVKYDLRNSSSVVRDGKYTVSVKAKNILGLEEEYEREYEVIFSSPMVIWDKSGAMRWYGDARSGIVIGSNTIESAPYFSARNVMFYFVSSSPLNTLTIYNNSDAKILEYDFTNEEFEIFRNKYLYIDNQVLKDVPDGLGYRGILSDIRGYSTTFYFHLDGRGPIVYPERISVDEELRVSMTIKSRDAVSGLRVPMDIREFDAPLEFSNIPEPRYPPLIQEATNNFYDSWGLSFRANSMNNAGLPGSLQFKTMRKSANVSMYVDGMRENEATPLFENGGILTVTRVDSVGVSVYNYRVPSNCVIIDPPTGMEVELWIEPMEKWFGYEIPVNDLGRSSITWQTFNVESLNEVRYPVQVFDIYGPGSYWRSENIRYNKYFPKFKLISRGNTNSGEWRCRVGTETVISEYGANTFYYPAYAYANLSGIAMDGIMMKYEWNPEYKYAPRTELPEFGITLNNLNIDGKVEVSKYQWGENKINVSGYKPYDSYVYLIKTDAVYDGPVDIEFKVDVSGMRYTQRQKNNITVYHASESDLVFKPIETERHIGSDGKGYIKARLPKLQSLFTVLVPYDDITPPVIFLRTYGSARGSYIKTDTYIDFDGYDMSGEVGDMSGYKETYYFINPPGDIEDCYRIFLSSYNERAAWGSCENPVYRDAFTLSEGTYTIYYTGVDRSGNRGSFKSEYFVVDETPPKIFVEVNGNKLENGATAYISVVDTITINVVEADYGSGVMAMGYIVDIEPEMCRGVEKDNTYPPGTCQNPEYIGGFNLSSGTHKVYYQAMDNAWNSTNGVNYFVVGYETGIDTVPPHIGVIYPYPDVKGIEKIVSGDIDIKAMIYDDNIERWKVEYSTSIYGNYIFISSGTRNIDGSVGLLKFDGFKGDYIIRITAVDRYGNINTKETSVYYGGPLYIKSIGRKSDIKVDLKNPYDIAITSDGYIWLSDSGNDRVLKMRKNGEVITEIGNGKKKGKSGEKKGNKEYRLSKPHGIALDNEGNIYVADTYNRRVVIYDFEGNFVKEITEFKERKDKKNLRLTLPTDLAVSEDEKIYILDMSYPKVVIYFRDGSFIKDIDLKDLKTDTDFCNELEDNDYKTYCSDNLKPYSIALEGRKIIISVINKGVIMAIDEDGNIIDGVGKGYVKRPSGIYLTKYYGYISDMKTRSIIRIDKETTNFMELIKWDKKEKFIPINLVIDDEGNMWVVDGLGGRVVKYSVASSGNARALSLSGMAETKTLKTFEVSSEKFEIKDAYIYPNPVKGNQKMYLYIEGGGAEKINVKIYNISGNMIKEFEAGNAAQIKDGKQAYIQRIDGEFSSGIYYWYIEASKGVEKIMRKGKFGVIR